MPADPTNDADAVHSSGETVLNRTPLFALHQELGAKLMPFAGWEMPVQYQPGIMAEHLHCRAHAALFDVSHMGQLTLRGPDPAGALERLVPGDLRALAPHRARYTMLTNEAGGIRDDLIVTNAEDHLLIVVNAGTTMTDLAHIRAHLEPEHTVEHLADRALLALQGPAAAGVLARLSPRVVEMRFMEMWDLTLAGIAVKVSRLGYTGEDGFEISLPAADAEAFARTLLENPEVRPAGLGARDSLRLEAGLSLYGREIDAATTPVEAGLGWTIGKRRREAGDFIGADTILRHLRHAPEQKLVGVRPADKTIAREGVEIQNTFGRPIGKVTSGGFGPSVGGPIALGYVEADFAQSGTELTLSVRGKPVPGEVVTIPFIPHRYHR